MWVISEGGAEVDLIVESGDELLAIEIKTGQRLDDGGDAWPIADGLLALSWR